MTENEDRKELTNEEMAWEALGKACHLTNKFLIDKNKSRIIELFQKIKESGEES